jgi:hypothetical protein
MSLLGLEHSSLETEHLAAMTIFYNPLAGEMLALQMLFRCFIEFFSE